MEENESVEKDETMLVLVAWREWADGKGGEAATVVKPRNLNKYQRVSQSAYKSRDQCIIPSPRRLCPCAIHISKIGGLLGACKVSAMEPWKEDGLACLECGVEVGEVVVLAGGDEAEMEGV